MPKVLNPCARTDIYERGSKIPDSKTKSGYRKDRSKPEDAQDKILIKKGEKYYTWSINFGGTFVSKTYPKPSQLTSSAFLQTAYSINERIVEFGNANEESDIENAIEEFKSEIQDLLDETEGSLDNMPEGLKEGETGQLLQERIDACQEAIDNLDAIDTNFEEYEIDEEAEDQDDEQEKANEKLNEWINEKIAEIQDCGIDV